MYVAEGASGRVGSGLGYAFVEGAEVGVGGGLEGLSGERLRVLGGYLGTTRISTPCIGHESHGQI